MFKVTQERASSYQLAAIIIIKTDTFEESYFAELQIRTLKVAACGLLLTQTLKQEIRQDQL